MKTYLTKEQRWALAFAKMVGCTIYFDSPRKRSIPHHGSDHRRIRVKGRHVHDGPILEALCRAFGQVNVKPYTAKIMNGVAEVPAVSIRRPDIPFSQTQEA